MSATAADGKESTEVVAEAGAYAAQGYRVDARIGVRQTESYNLFKKNFNCCLNKLTRKVERKYKHIYGYTYYLECMPVSVVILQGVGIVIEPEEEDVKG